MIFLYVLIFCVGFCCGWSGFALAIGRIEREGRHESETNP